jgi:hypothetical protein
MASPRKILFVALVLLYAAAVQAEAVTIFDSNATISSGDAYDVVVVKGNGTVVDMTGGDVNSVMLMNASTFNISDGNIRGVWNDTEESYDEAIISYDSSAVNILGGNVGKVHAHGDSSVNVLSNGHIEGYFFNSSVASVSSYNATGDGLAFSNNSTLNLSAGSINYIRSSDSSTLNMTGGDVCDVQVSYAVDSQLNISGGSVLHLGVYAAGGDADGKVTLRLSGGNIDMIGYGIEYWSSDFASCDILIIGYGISAVPYGGAYGHGQITGFWNDDIYYTIDLASPKTYAHLKLYDGVIPPKCSAKPVSDLTDDCKVNFIDFDKVASEWLDCGLDDPNDC